MRRWQRFARSVIGTLGLEGPARWVWRRRPGTRRHRRFAAWLAEADRSDNERIKLILAAVLPEDANCLDVGAGSGELTAEMVRCAPNGVHIAYEALPELCAEVSRRLPGVQVCQAAVSDRSGDTEFLFVPEAPGWSSIRDYEDVQGSPGRRRIVVRSVSLDESLPDGFTPSLIKIDVNGAELQVFEGAKRTIREHKPVVIFEHGRAAASYGTTPEMIFSLLTSDCGLRIYDLDGNGPFSSTEFAEAVEARWNFMARS